MCWECNEILYNIYSDHTTATTIRLKKTFSLTESILSSFNPVPAETS